MARPELQDCDKLWAFGESLGDEEHKLWMREFGVGGMEDESILGREDVGEDGGRAPDQEDQDNGSEEEEDEDEVEDDGGDCEESEDHVGEEVMAAFINLNDDGTCTEREMPAETNAEACRQEDSEEEDIYENGGREGRGKDQRSEGEEEEDEDESGEDGEGSSPWTDEERLYHALAIALSTPFRIQPPAPQSTRNKYPPPPYGYVHADSLDTCPTNVYAQPIVYHTPETRPDSSSQPAKKRTIDQVESSLSQLPEAKRAKQSNMSHKSWKCCGFGGHYLYEKELCHLCTHRCPPGTPSGSGVPSETVGAYGRRVDASWRKWADLEVGKGEVVGYPPKWTPLPPGLEKVDIVLNFPNHLRGKVLLEICGPYTPTDIARIFGDTNKLKANTLVKRHTAAQKKRRADSS